MTTALSYTFYLQLLFTFSVFFRVVAKLSYSIANINAYGFDKTSTEYLKDYLSHRKQKIKISKTLATGQIYYMEYHKAPYWIHYLLMSFIVISFCLYQTST